jgi:hypothetical protein
MMRIAFVLGFALSLTMASSQKPPHSLAPEERDFRGCDGDWIHVNDFWTSNPSDLYRLATTEADFRACDRDWNTPSGLPATEDSED